MNSVRSKKLSKVYTIRLWRYRDWNIWMGGKDSIFSLLKTKQKLMSYIWLSKTPIPDIFLGAGRRVRRASFSPSSPIPCRGGGTSSKPPSLISIDFPSNNSCTVFFFLLASCSCFYTLRPLQIVILTLSCGTSRREMMRFVGRRV